MSVIKFGILTVSDTCYKDPTKDTSGQNLKDIISKWSRSSEVTSRKIVPDEIDEIKSVLIKWSDEKICDVILTTGGTGFAKRDVTPEATRTVIEKEAPGLSYAMISNSLAITHTAMLSRAVCGIRSQTLIINLPGSRKGAAECFEFVKDAIPHAVALLKDEKVLVTLLHKTVQHKGAGDGSVRSRVKVNNVASRIRQSPYPLIEVAKATQIVFENCVPIEESETVSFDESINRILAEDVYALEPVPLFRASIKDGYAVIAEDGAGLRNIKEVTAAGDAPLDQKLKPGEAVRISTGAPLPPGANAVVQVEDTTLVKASPDGTVEVTIEIKVPPKLNQDIREIGSDVPQNSLVLNKYDRIKPADIGVMAMLGKTKINVFKRASVGVISTGNELIDPRGVAEVLPPGKIRDANKFTLTQILGKYSYDPMDCGIVRDDPDSVKSALEKAFSSNDVVISSGGLSMGEFDVLKQVLVEDFGAKIHFARVNMKPGKPTTFATLVYKEKRKIYFGLPGNPVSCGVTCLLYVVPALKYMERSSNYKFPIIRVGGLELVNNDPRPEYHRVRVSVDPISGEFKMRSTGNQISSRLNSLVGANGLAVVKKGVKTSTYNVMLFDDLL
ncbi:gephyrin [Diorhabda carinulata]|uniref:gephyrin n=1 Tax=Diorhabda carinulata TaxID=1163345 RepID=UPI0025A068F2|nr:gephyrin [Diorhabda carinulata]XP_057652616.1 gephyrin [Diorhabda carinulata]XP_057652617.1 gephyrin [Diorhabda carinulata]XP_057652619.1 gephyrin [Diorhabda carinulata]XP_057652620.1 gephyrin [Diorhabda carinulata]